MPIYLGTGGYSDTDLVGALYPVGTKKTEFLTEYAKHYPAVEINSSFYAPIGRKAYEGMLNKSENNLKFAIKLHQDFSHNLTATPQTAIAFMDAIRPIIEADCLASLLLQFPHGFDRTIHNRQYLAMLTSWFVGLPLAIEFRHQSWHTPQVYASFTKQNLSWCSVDYPNVKGLPPSGLLFTNRIGYLRMHGKNVNWWDAHSASERHDYRYSEAEMQAWAMTIANQQANFDTLYVFFENTVKAHAVYNIAMLQHALLEQNLAVIITKTTE
ncbi:MULTISPECIES: DUF72 domain-containing protein [unclassified Moraxella]|uniref:DUF72 domain-containing protein n=1 Tax=unclassified Moraxella TaxID=2685852 RepID=UPI003AF6153F